MEITVKHVHTLDPAAVALLQGLLKSNGVSPLAETTTEKVVAEKSKNPFPNEPAADIQQASLEEVRAAVLAKTQAGKRTQVKDLLTKWGAENVTSLAKENYTGFLTEINAL